MQWTMFLVILFVSVLILIILKNRKQTNQLVEKINGGAQLLDVRTRKEFNAGAIEGAVNIPLNDLKNDVSKLDLNQYYITYCSHGVRSIRAMKLLKTYGVSHVDNGGAMKHLSRKLKKNPN